ncbi:MAG: hypothetical protein PHP29_01480 [Tissierellia bacterium]|nr:hypothetical protein [Tissierellia bacterium]
MKKLLIIVILIGAVGIFYRQPEYYQKGHITIEQNTYKLYEKDNFLYIKTGKEFTKLIDEEIIDYKIYNIDSDDNEEILVIIKHETEGYGSDFIIYDIEEVGGSIKTKEIYRQDFSDIKPWKVDACNLDNDGETDIFIGVYKDTVYYKDVRNRPFFYSWNGERLNKKWLGSFFTDWELVDIAFGDYYNQGYDVACVLEKNNDSYRVGYYKFVGFGFINMDTSEIYSNVNSIETVREEEIDTLFLNFSGIRKNMQIQYIKSNN